MNLIFAPRVRFAARSTFGIVAAFLCLASAAGAEIQVVGAWSLPLPPASVNGAVYLKVHNPGSSADRLLAAESDIAAKVEIHEHALRDGQMSMMRLHGLDLHPGATVEFVPSGLHLMLLGLARPLVRGERYSLTLEFEHAGRIPVEVSIEDRSGLSTHAGHSAAGGSGAD